MEYCRQISKLGVQKSNKSSPPKTRRGLGTRSARGGGFGGAFYLGLQTTPTAAEAAVSPPYQGGELWTRTSADQLFHHAAVYIS